MSRGKTTTKTLRTLRTLLLVGLVGFIVLVITLYRFGRAGMAPREKTPVDESAPRNETVVMSGKGFDYTITQGEQALARIRADRIVSEREEEIVLEGINPIEVYRDDGDLYRVFSDTGTYNLESQQTTLAGSVRIEAPDGLELYAESLLIGGRGRTVTSNSAVGFRMLGEFAGRARNLRADLNRDIFSLWGNVIIDGTSPERDPIRLTCNRIVYERGEALVSTTGNVRFHQGESFIWAPSMQFQLTEPGNKLRHVSAQRGVVAQYLKRFGATIERRLELSGDALDVVVDPASSEPKEGELRAGAETGTARVWTTDEASVVRSLTAPVLHALFENGEISYAEAFNDVHLRETLAFDSERILRWACGDHAEIHFSPDGEIRQATFYERVDFRDAQALLLADRIDMTGDPYEVVMHGDPARAVSAQGELTAPEIIQQGEDGDVRALGGVRGIFDQGRGKSSLSMSGGKGPVRLASDSAVWHRGKDSFEFEDDVRIWQEESLLLADRIETRTDENLIIARGSVKTVLVPEEADEKPGEKLEKGGTADEAADEPAPQENKSAPEEGPGRGRDPVEITSQWMEYNTEAKNIIYHEDVLITQVGRRMVCDEAEAQMLDAGGGLEWLDCRGNAKINDNVARRSVSGDTAFYEVARGEITFRGKPVILTGEKGERLEGRTLVYDVATGGARIRGEDGR